MANTTLTLSQVSDTLKLSAQAVQTLVRRGELTCARNEYGWRVFDAAEVEAYKARRGAAAAGMSIAQVATMLEVTQQTVRSLADQGKLQCQRDPRGWRVFDAAEVEAYRARRVAPTAGMSLAQVAGALGLSPQTVRNLADAGEIPSRRDAKGWRVFDAVEVEAYRAAHPEHRERSQARSARQKIRADLLAAVDAAGPRGLAWSEVKQQPGWELAFEKLFQDGTLGKKCYLTGAIVTRKPGA